MAAFSHRLPISLFLAEDNEMQKRENPFYFSDLGVFSLSEYG